MSELLFTPKQARVLAALVEKSITTPQYYPMTVNALMAACNQKNCRYPLMQLNEGEVGSALLDLLDLSLVAEDRGSRVVKWRHRFTHHLLLKEPAQAVLIALMLRGPQTVSELRANTSSLRGPADLAGVEAVLEDLADRAQPIVKLLERAPGQKEERYAHLLCGEDEIPQVASRAAPVGGVAANRLDELEARMARVEAQLATLLERQQD
jgi:uncharacterized protein YceH (UPF0502 family)